MDEQPHPQDDRRRWRGVAAMLAAILFAVIAFAALAPIQVASRDLLFEIPPGTHARRMAGDRTDILPQTIRLTLGIKDRLVFRNRDDAPHIFGPTLIMPGQSFTLPFAVASTYSFQCTAHADGSLDIVVEPSPSPGWRRLQWRWRSLTSAG